MGIVSLLWCSITNPVSHLRGLIISSVSITVYKNLGFGRFLGFLIIFLCLFLFIFLLHVSITLHLLGVNWVFGFFFPWSVKFRWSICSTLQSIFIFIPLRNLVSVGGFLTILFILCSKSFIICWKAPALAQIPMEPTRKLHSLSKLFIGSLPFISSNISTREFPFLSHSNFSFLKAFI